MSKILMFEISAKNCSVTSFRGILGSEGNTSYLAAHFSRFSFHFTSLFTFTIETLRRYVKDDKIKSTVFKSSPHHKIILPMLKNRELQFWTTVNFENEYFLNEETEDVLTNTVVDFHD